MPPSPRAAGARKRPLETRRFRAIRSRPRIRGIILKCPGLSLDRGRDREREREREREEGKRKEKKDRDAPARLDAPKCVAPGNFERTPIYLERSHTRGRRSLYAAATRSYIVGDSAARNRPDFSVSPSCRKSAISRRESEGATLRADTRVTPASANVTRGGYLLLEEFRRRSAKMLASADRILIRRRYSSDERTPRLNGEIATRKSSPRTKRRGAATIFASSRIIAFPRSNSICRRRNGDELSALIAVPCRRRTSPFVNYRPLDEILCKSNASKSSQPVCVT